MLKVSNLAVGYHGKAVFHHGNFEVEAGKITTLLGKSGVGKSSLLRTLAGLETPLAGSISLFGQRVTQPQPEIGFVFQSANLLPWLSVLENVAFGLDFASQQKLGKRLNKSEILQRAEQALAEVNLLQAAHKKPAELSGGMAQRVNLARALARQPKLILLDEPFSALDPITRQQMQQLLTDLVQRHHAAAVLITHDLDEALAVSHDILLLGTKVDEQPAEIIEQWQIASPFPRQHLLSLNELRVGILQSLTQYQQRITTERTVEFMI